MSPARTTRTEHMRLATLLEIGRGLSNVADVDELRLSVLAGLSKLFDDDRLFCADVDAGWSARVFAVATHGQARRAEATYPAVSTTATSDDGIALDPHGAAVLAASIGGPLGAIGAVVVPVRLGDRVVGELGSIRASGDPPADEDGDLLAFGAAIIAAGFAQRQRIDETEKRRREAERLEEIGRAITSSLDLDEVLERVLDAALDLTRADACTVWRREREGRSVAIASRGPEAVPVGTAVEGAPQVAKELLTNRSIVQIDDIASDPRLPAALRDRFAAGPQSSILVPMLTGETVVGVLAVNHREPQRYDAEAMGILERLALQAAIAVENARLHAEIRDLSLTDPLTALPNRRHMDMVLRKEFEAARRGRPLAVAVIDLDDFKAYNDTHGHAGGDEVLRDFAAVLAGETRAMNLAVRYGGDEFLTILSESTLEGAEHLVERIAAKVRAHPRLCTIGFSAGVAEFSPEMRTPEELIAAADSAMYRQKLDTPPTPA